MVFTVLTIAVVLLAILTSQNKKAKKIYCYIIGASFIFFAGFRSLLVGTDSLTYAKVFQNTMPITKESFFAAFEKKEFFYKILTGVLRRITDNYTILFFIVALFFISVVCFLVRKYSTSPMLSFILFMSMGYFSFSMAGIRQTIAMGFLFLALDRMLKKKYVAAVILVLIASGFHITSLIYFLAILIYFIPFNIFSILVASALSIFIYVSGNSLTTRIVDVVWGDSRGYGKFEYGGISTLILLVVVFVAACIFYPGLIKYSKTRKQEKDQSMEIDSYFIKLLMFSIPFQIMTTYQANAFRIAMLFHFPMILLLPNVISKQQNRVVRIVAKVVVIGCLMYQLFAITYGSADINPFTFFWQV